MPWPAGTTQTWNVPETNRKSNPMLWLAAETRHLTHVKTNGDPSAWSLCETCIPSCSSCFLRRTDATALICTEGTNPTTA